MLFWTEGEDEVDDIGGGEPTKVKWLKASANGIYAYRAEQLPDGYWALYRKWTGHLVTADHVARVVCNNKETIKAKAEDDLEKWKAIISELTGIDLMERLERFKMPSGLNALRLD